MRDITTKLDNDPTSAGLLTAEEFNSHAAEVEGVVRPYLGLDALDNQQMAKAIDIAAKSGFYQDVGSPNAVHLVRGATSSQIEVLTDGMAVMFSPAHANTGASTLKVNGLPARGMGFKNSPLQAGMLKVGEVYMAVYSSQGFFNCYMISSGGSPLNVVDKAYVDGLIAGLEASKDDKYGNSVPIMQSPAGSQIVPFNGWAKPFGTYALEFTTNSGVPWGSKPAAEREMFIGMGKEGVQHTGANFEVYRVTMPAGREGAYAGAYHQARFFSDRDITCAAFTKLISGNPLIGNWAEGMTTSWGLTGANIRGNSNYTNNHPLGNPSGSACVFLVALPATIYGSIDLSEPQAWWQFPNFDGGWG